VTRNVVGKLENKEKTFNNMYVWRIDQYRKGKGSAWDKEKVRKERKEKGEGLEKFSWMCPIGVSIYSYFRQETGCLKPLY
jgi:hypothetical protein